VRYKVAALGKSWIPAQYGRILFAMEDNPGKPATSPEQIKYIGSLNMVGAQRLIKEISENQPTNLFHLVMVRILQKLAEENNILMIKDARISDIAWAVRNIMELRVMSAYARLSEANLQRFEYDVIASGVTTMKALLELGQNLAGEVENGVNPTPDLYRVHADIQKTRVKLGLGKEEPLKLPFPAFLAGRGILKSPEVRRKC
jgi:hypothetical protein